MVTISNRNIVAEHNTKSCPVISNACLFDLRLPPLEASRIMLDETAKTCEKKSTYQLKRHSFCYLLDPFGNHWWSLPSDWLSAVWFIHDSHYFLLEMTFVLNRTIFALYCIISVLNTKLDVKVFLFLLLLDPYNFGTDRIRRFQNGSN